MWVDAIARPSNMIVYEVPGMGINPAHNRQDVFVNGVNWGVDVNY